MLAAVSAHVLCSSAPQLPDLMAKKHRIIQAEPMTGLHNCSLAFTAVSRAIPMTGLHNCSLAFPAVSQAIYFFCAALTLLLQRLITTFFLFFESQSSLPSLSHLWWRSLQFGLSCSASSVVLPPSGIFFLLVLFSLNFLSPWHLAHLPFT